MKNDIQFLHNLSEFSPGVVVVVVTGIEEGRERIPAEP